ncbi:hypothetical protein CANCADRAFT_56157 [Tortispora caseinolytica NRRL Y-17796]|uniref:Phospho-2-dehydro-3-deoxyheptonate aldolase n=1 Tax=Tortispora caseinolytica NRRL Y-17796 TaxID=767744 RepID=A0A1E4TL78_9ASCO|nr:hypothetical protein CANCADRAFT_56157 [Tortispora caseinolytica NRRL Y-17796]
MTAPREIKHKIITTEPPRLAPSEGAKLAAKLRTLSMSPTESFRPSGLKDEWTPTSWQAKPIQQDVVYDDAEAVEKALEKLESLPPLVTPHEINKLREKLKDAAEGNAFVLQGGDCAELFNYCTQEAIEGRLRILLQMSMVLVWGLKLPIIRIGRIAGQFAKPRSKLTEMIQGQEYPSFRGDNINGYELEDRTPDPARLVSAYFHSAATLNYIRGAIASGFADLRRSFDWDFSHVQSFATRTRYEEVADSISEMLQFMHTVGADHSQQLNTVDFFTSHEGLHLEYEQSLTRKLKDGYSTDSTSFYDTSTHFLWIGDRTRQIDGAHVEFFRGIRNPIGVKVGPSMKDSELVDLLNIVDPNFETGRVTLITRYGCTKIKDHLSSQIEAVRNSGHKVVWMVDPCHGNTKVSPKTELKTRYLADILSELQQALEIHSQNNSRVSGVHLELTGDAVTECIGGSEGLEDEDLVIRYLTVCDPRLSSNQSLDAAFLIADWFKKNSA